MPPKKKAGVSKTDIKPEPILDEKPPADSSGYALTGNIEVDLPEYLRALGVTHPPVVYSFKTNLAENEEIESHQEAPMHLPRVNVLFKEEPEGKTTVQNITSVHFRNFHIRDIEAKVISQCLTKLDKLESVYFFRSRLCGDIFNLIALPSSVKTVQIYGNPNPGDLWLAALRKAFFLDFMQ
ncbi:Oidioi.mRNA.OKI2018_I69.XSR.g15783.t2.cds [Oikopleura dioica]|uniref:Oidioi.mRNA.OKI2018_I69.XSR.g15783.t2.cds n=1 Tax=Oikopleura dioica TaxID=34765 RepID=A0ABN7SI58_OIKDI|nr:Oidioi.mRNA.OKI2018_I69.XSR.g15783.t2.cds [Oikopleura dioica]